MRGDHDSVLVAVEGVRVRGQETFCDFLFVALC